MKLARPTLVTILFNAALLVSLPAQAQADRPMSAAERKASLYQLADKVEQNYVFPDVAKALKHELRQRADNDSYREQTSARALASQLSKDLPLLSKDKHFRVNYAPEFVADEKPFQAPSAAEVAENLEQAQIRAYGIERVERLNGNIGYLDLRGFGPAYAVASGYTAALTLLSGTDALILDLRRNRGGKPEGVALLLSYFFNQGDERHLNSIYSRPENQTRDFYTSDNIGPRYNKPVYVLTSSSTFSGAEECAYDFQTQKRATLIGEVTGGGANPVAPYAIANGLVAAIPFGRAINPITKTNWEGVGVQPDLPSSAADALKLAYQTALETLIRKPRDEQHQQVLQRTLARLQKAEIDLPAYK